jgi:hypothetical protein
LRPAPYGYKGLGFACACALRAYVIGKEHKKIGCPFGQPFLD